MTDPQTQTDDKPLTPEEMKEANNRARKVPTRPSWIALVVALGFFSGLAAFVTQF